MRKSSHVHVLVIDDDDVDRERIRRTLGKYPENFVVSEAESLDTGIEIAWQDNIDVVVLDLTLQSTSGLQTLARFRKLAPELPIVLVSGIADEEMALESIRSGAEDFITKEGFENNWFKIVLRNAIERHETRKKLLIYSEKLEQANEDLAQFAYVASHDLQEPLRAIQGFGAKLQKEAGDTLTEQWSGYTGRMIDGAERMSQLIHDLLDYSHHTLNECEFLPVALSACVQAAQQNLRESIDEEQAEVTFGKLPIIKGNLGQLVQLFQNLIGNALKYRCPEHPPRISITSVATGGGTRILIADNGIGIAKEFQNQIFGLFKRLHRREEYPGTGIGLAICKKVVERHGGKISLESSPGEGCTFCLHFPSSCIVKNTPTA